MSTIVVGGERLALLPEKAAFLPDHGTLLIADAHVGKSASFRRLGIPVPGGTTTETLTALDTLVERVGARRIVFLGDLLHSAHAHAAPAMAAFVGWRRLHPELDLTLVRGNHDDRAGDPPARLGIVTVDEPLRLGGLWLCHHPVARAGGYVLGGHRHPCVTLSGRAFDRLRLPCFWFARGVGVLPAFGAFTGMHPIGAVPGDRIFVVADRQVDEVWSPQPRVAARR